MENISLPLSKVNAVKGLRDLNRTQTNPYIAASIANLAANTCWDEGSELPELSPAGRGACDGGVQRKSANALGEAASKLHAELGESLATVQKIDVPLAEATTPSMEALKAYSLS